jgi:hypothetical protein
MKRDCGDGELIPNKFQLIWCQGASDTEHKQALPLDLVAARDTFRTKVAALTEPYSSVRLYVEDRKGYRNCILSASRDSNGGIQPRTDRTNEL